MLLDKELIISLTSYPDRIDTAHQSIQTLLNQTYKADKIILWLAEEQFPNREKELPQQLLDLKASGLIIDWCEDIRSYKKLIPTLRKYPNAYIATADDDIFYDKNVLKRVVKTYLKNQTNVIAYNAHFVSFNEGKLADYINWTRTVYNKKPSYNNFLTSGCMALFYPDCFYKDILRQDLFMQLCSDTDDMWFWAMTVLNDVKIKIADNCKTTFDTIDGTQEHGLWQTKNKNGNNDNNLKLILEYYPQLMEKLEKTDCIYQHSYEKIFSIKNKYYGNKKYKYVTFLGLNKKIKL